MTAQVPDGLKIGDQTYRLFTNPLDTLPAYRRPHFVSDNTACWRGYVAYWEIKDDTLYLVDLFGSVCVRPEIEGAARASCGGHHRNGCETRKIRANDLFDMSAGLLPADWYSGDLRVPQGRQLKYIHMGYASRYERYLILEIANGRLVGSRTLSPPAPPSKTSRLLARLAAILGIGGKRR